MGKNRRFKAYYFFFCLAIGLFFYLKNSPSPAYFHTEKIVKLVSGGIPCVRVYLNDAPIDLEFDSGFEGDLSLDEEILAPLQKTFLKEKTFFGVRGKSYQEKVYSGPSIKIAGIQFDQIEVKEGSKEFNQDSVVFDGSKKKVKEERPGRIGWTLFSKLNLFIDIPNSQIGMCDSIQTLQSRGYFKNGFIKTPLLQDKPYIGIQVVSSSGPLNCCIDTGATLCVLNSSIEPQDFCLEFLQLEKNNIGPFIFFQFPIGMPKAPDAFLGMNFLAKHTVFVNFKEQAVYISLEEDSPNLLKFFGAPL